jgi:Ca2+-binding EF-hand superfamily protein
MNIVNTIGLRFGYRKSISIRLMQNGTPTVRHKLLRRISEKLSAFQNVIKQVGHFMIASAGRLAARLPQRVLRILIGGFVKELKSRKLNWEELHYILMDDLTLEDIYQLIINDHSMNQTSAEYGGIVNFLDAKAKLEATKILPDLDLDKDGDVSPKEVVQFISKTVRSQLSHAVDIVDADGDGRVGVNDIFAHFSGSLRDLMFREKKDPPRPPS